MITISTFPHRRSITAISCAAALALAASAMVPHAAAQDAPQALAEKHRPAPEPDRIATTIAGNAATSRAVSWRTDASIASGEAQIAKLSGWTEFASGAKTVAGTTTPVAADLGYTNHFHQVVFEDLDPGTQYLYRVGDAESGTWSEWIEFSTAAKGAEDFSFLFLGDAQNDIEEHWTRVVQRAYRHGSDAELLVHPGDLINVADRDREWGEWTGAAAPQAASIPNLVVPGNHEYFREDGSRELSDYWRLQFELPSNGPRGHEDFEGTVYSADYQGVRFICLNSAYREAEPDDSEGQARFLERQAAWLEDQLADNDNRWTVVFFHHPTYATAAGRDNQALRDRWRPILEDYGVDLVLSGHDHTYGRGYTRTDTDTGPVRITGPVYVNSVSGPKMYEASGRNWVENGAVAQKLGEDVQLYQVIEVRDRACAW